MTPGGLDWPGLMRAGMQALRLHPDRFWSLTPAELALMAGLGQVAPRMNAERLAALAARYPDAPVPALRPDDEGESEHVDE